MKKNLHVINCNVASKVKKFVLSMMIVFLLTSCDEVYACKDNKLPTSFEPIKYTEDVVFTASFEFGDTSIIAWDSKTKKHLATYSFKRIMNNEKSNFLPYGFLRYKETVWVLLRGCRKYLLKIDTPTGKVTELKLDMFPSSIVLKNNELWVISQVYGDKKIPIDIRHFSIDGKKLLNSFSFILPKGKAKDYTLDSNSIYNHNGEWYFNVKLSGSIPINDEGKDCSFLYQINLNTKKIKPLCKDVMKVIFPEEPLKKIVGKHMAFNIRKHNLVAMHYFENPNGDSNDRHYISEIESYVPLKIKSPIIASNTKRPSYYISKTDKHLYIVGRVGGIVEGGEPALEVGLFDKSGGKEKQAIKLLGANQYLYDETENEIWIGTDMTTTKDGKPIHKAYILDKNTGKVSLLNATNNKIENIGQFKLK